MHEINFLIQLQCYLAGLVTFQRQRVCVQDELLGYPSWQQRDPNLYNEIEVVLSADE